MPLPMPIDGVTFQVGVSDMERARGFYDALFGQPPDFVAAEDFQESEPHPGFWLQITTRLAPGQMRRLRFGVADIVAARGTLIDEGLDVDEVERIPDVVAWCNFSDVDGNPLGLYQDLATPA